MPEADKQGKIGVLRSRNDRAGVKAGNTPDKIYTRKEGAAFYCHVCRKKYQKCNCEVYISADTVGDEMSEGRERKVSLCRRTHRTRFDIALGVGEQRAGEQNAIANANCHEIKRATLRIKPNFRIADDAAAR
jgi:hypothetical protein